jgi:hypothetical protein
VVRKVACGAAEVIPLVAVTNLARTWKSSSSAAVGGRYRGRGRAGLPAGPDRPLVMIMGAEGKGMRRLTREHCDFLVKLPMAGSVSSLNVSVATGVCLFEACVSARPSADSSCRRLVGAGFPRAVWTMFACKALHNPAGFPAGNCPPGEYVFRLFKYSPICLSPAFYNCAPCQLAGAHVPRRGKIHKCHSLLV